LHTSVSFSLSATAVTVSLTTSQTSSTQPSFLTPLQADSLDQRGVLSLLALVDTGKPCSTRKEIMYTIFDEKERKIPLERPKLKWDDNIKTDLTQIRFGNVY
jgi:hypothetical protein